MISVPCCNPKKESKVVTIAFATTFYMSQIWLQPSSTIATRNYNNDHHKLKQEEWEKLTHETYINLIKSMSNRIETCIKSQGWPTEY